MRDVVERHAVSQPVALRWMIRQLLSNPGGSFSVSKFYRDLKSQGFVCANPDDRATQDREFRTLVDAKSDHRRATLHLIALDQPSALETPQHITVHSASSWFLS